MNDFIFAGKNLRKESQISTSFKERIKAELDFHFFHFFFHIFPRLLNEREEYFPIRVKEIRSFSRD